MMKNVPASVVRKNHIVDNQAIAENIIWVSYLLRWWIETFA
ncbi:hypothetical protein [Siphonobacter sp. SORGH_AS_0500]|nr:hypothetical protein [Siphonobacter sp. SORGH_AS_0500]MDR6194922.1 hypothetical protein [Siphonobacter sp. SORGH_AS_0500]